MQIKNRYTNEVIHESAHKTVRGCVLDAIKHDADLTWADLTWANLTWANLTRADLTDADLTGANLTGADMDYSSGIPLWCGGSKFKCSAKLIHQLFAHISTLEVVDADDELRAALAAILPEAKKSRRAEILKIK